MIVIDNLKSQTITPLVEKNISGSSIVDSDDSTSYGKLKDVVKEHRPKVIPKEEVGKMLPWVHIAISNAKRMLLDVFHDIKPEYLQYYLNEYCYKFNRRYFGENLFDRLMIASVSLSLEFIIKTVWIQKVPQVNSSLFLLAIPENHDFFITLKEVLFCYKNDLFSFSSQNFKSE